MKNNGEGFGGKTNTGSILLLVFFFLFSFILGQDSKEKKTKRTTRGLAQVGGAAPKTEQPDVT